MTLLPYAFPMSPNVPGLIRRVLLLATLSTTSVFALSGTVKNQDGIGLVGATVSLMSDSTVRQMTDSNGTFVLPSSSGISQRGEPGLASANLSPLALLSVLDNRVSLSLRAPINKGSFSLYAGDGTKRFEKELGRMTEGSHSMDLPSMGPGLYTVRLSLDGVRITRQFVFLGSGAAVSSGLLRAPVGSARASRTAAVDSVVVTKFGYRPTKSPVTSYTQNDLAITLTLDTVSLLPGITDYSANGPYATVVETNVGPGNAYTIYRPETLGANGFLHAPIIYGHGISAQVSGFAPFLRNVASHGFVIIACNILTGGPNNAGNTAAMTNGLNWILQQDTTTGSKFQGKLATKRAASMGYSVGGTAAVDIGAHPALQTVVSIHGHISSAILHGSLLQTSGTQDNVGLPMQQQTFNNSVVPTFLGTVTGANHGYIQSDNGGVQRPAIVAWLRYRLYNDQGAKRYFYGSDCVLCTAPWENPQRKKWY